ncbi:MAG: ChbG/HpnK family deacetylase [Candidatus Omnitrophota bacterium]|nr:ChbG/HpnK family deacetylase [Candidatus Omnitrophota bacterium]
MKYLIVSADDFGFSKDINAGIVKAYKEGIVTHLNLMPAGAAFDDALELSSRMKLEEAGAHLSLTEEMIPLTKPHRIETLVREDNKFHRSHRSFFANLLLRNIDVPHVYRELKNQMETLKASGIRLTCLSSHEHIHMAPAMLRIFVRLAKEYGIPSIRCLCSDMRSGPFSVKKFCKKALASYFEKGMTDILKGSDVVYADNFLGFIESGEINEETLLAMLNNLREGVTELACHPGFLSPELLNKGAFHLNCETELAALTSRRVKMLIKKKEIRLITYGEFLKK